MFGEITRSHLSPSHDPSVQHTLPATSSAPAIAPRRSWDQVARIALIIVAVILGTAALAACGLIPPLFAALSWCGVAILGFAGGLISGVLARHTIMPLNPPIASTRTDPTLVLGQSFSSGRRSAIPDPSVMSAQRRPHPLQRFSTAPAIHLTEITGELPQRRRTHSAPSLTTHSRAAAPSPEETRPRADSVPTAEQPPLLPQAIFKQKSQAPQHRHTLGAGIPPGPTSQPERGRRHSLGTQALSQSLPPIEQSDSLDDFFGPSNPEPDSGTLFRVTSHVPQRRHSFEYISETASLPEHRRRHSLGTQALSQSLPPIEQSDSLEHFFGLSDPQPFSDSSTIKAVDTLFQATSQVPQHRHTLGAGIPPLTPHAHSHRHSLGSQALSRPLSTFRPDALSSSNFDISASIETSIPFSDIGATSEPDPLQDLSHGTGIPPEQEPQTLYVQTIGGTLPAQSSHTRRLTRFADTLPQTDLQAPPQELSDHAPQTLYYQTIRGTLPAQSQTRRLTLTAGVLSQAVAPILLSSAEHQEIGDAESEIDESVTFPHRTLNQQINAQTSSLGTGRLVSQLLTVTPQLSYPSLTQGESKEQAETKEWGSTWTLGKQIDPEHKRNLLQFVLTEKVEDLRLAVASLPKFNAEDPFFFQLLRSAERPISLKTIAWSISKKPSIGLSEIKPISKQMVDILLDHVIDINAVNEQEMSLLKLAILEMHFDLIPSLLEHKIKVTSQAFVLMQSLPSPKYDEVKKKYLPMLTPSAELPIVLNRYPNVLISPEELSKALNDKALMETINASKLDCRQLLCSKFHGSLSPSEFAMIYSTTKQSIMKLDFIYPLANMALPVDEPIDQQYTLLHFAVNNFDLGLAKKLCNLGANPRISVNGNKSPLELAKDHNGVTLDPFVKLFEKVESKPAAISTVSSPSSTSADSTGDFEEPDFSTNPDPLSQLQSAPEHRESHAKRKASERSSSTGLGLEVDADVDDDRSAMFSTAHVDFNTAPKKAPKLKAAKPVSASSQARKKAFVVPPPGRRMNFQVGGIPLGEALRFVAVQPRLRKKI